MKKPKNKRKIKKQGKGLDNARKLRESQNINNRPTISVCLIVKDEERFLYNCLKSVKDIADEVIIIDTGSRDKTVDIAKKYTDKVYFHSWQNSFSEARNHYFEYATGDWIFHIDADEELVKEDIPVLLNAVKNMNVDLILVPIISHLEKGKTEGMHNGERLFRNNGIIRYRGRIHESLTGYKIARVYPIRLMHYGYDLKDDELSEEKHQRRVRLLKMDIQDDPNNPVPWHYLSVCYLYRDLYNETIDAGLKAIELAKNQNNKDPLFLSTRYNVAMAYYESKDYKNSEAVCLSALALNKQHLDSWYLLTAVYFEQSRWTEVIEYGSKYLNLAVEINKRPQDFGTMVMNSFGSGWKIQVLKGIACYETGETEEAEKSFSLALENSNNQFTALKLIGAFYFNKGLMDLSGKYLERAINLNKDDPNVIELLDKIRSGRVSPEISPVKKNGQKEDIDTLNNLLSLHISDRMPDKAMDIINNHAEKLDVPGSILCRIAVLFLEKGDIESAFKCYMMAVEKDNSLFEAWESLGELMLAMGKLDDSRTFFEKALSIRNNDIGTILNLCDIAAREADIVKVVEYCERLLKIIGIAHQRTLGNMDDLLSIMNEISYALKGRNHHDHINLIAGRIAEMKNQIL